MKIIRILVVITVLVVLTLPIIPALAADPDSSFNLVTNGDRVTVGETGSKDFTPSVKLEKWNGESYYKLIPENNITTGLPKEATNISELSKITDSVKEKISVSSADKSIGIYTLTDNEIKDGGLEYELILKTKPATNIFTWRIESSPDVVFYYQPELTEAEKAEGCGRPDNVIGSYAVYSNSKRDNSYGTGKIGHIYRPELIAADGARTWGILEIKDNIMTIKIDSKWLDNAKYPVVLDPTFGYTGAGASYQNVGNDNDWFSTVITTPYVNTVTSITVSCEATYWNDIKAVITDENAGANRTIVANGIGNASAHFVYTDVPAKNWRTSTFATSPELADSTEYDIGYIINAYDEGTYGLMQYYDTGTTHYTRSEPDNNYGAPANPATIFTGTASRIYSIYATYVSDYDPPTVTTGTAIVEPGQFTLNGNLTDLGGAATCSCYFEYGPTGAYGSTTAPQTLSGTGAYSATVTGIKSDMTIYYRAVASNVAWPGYGSQSSFISSAKINQFPMVVMLIMIFPTLLMLGLLSVSGFLEFKFVGAGNIQYALIVFLVTLILIGIVVLVGFPLLLSALDAMRFSSL